jgi:hypothetical protein
VKTVFPGWTAAALVLALVAGHATRGVDAPWRARATTTYTSESLDAGIAHTPRVLERGASSRAPARPASGHHALAASRWTFADDTAASTIVVTALVPAARPARVAGAARSRGPPLS